MKNAADVWSTRSARRALTGCLQMVVGFLRWIDRRWVSRVIDMTTGMETTEVRVVDELGLPPDSAHDYVPSSWRSLRVLPKDDVTNADVFIDYGCGKGRILWLARRYRFARIIGVELSPDLAEMARANHKQDRRVQIVCADAARYQVPDTATHFYFFNPFPLGVVEQVLDRIDESHARRPRRLTVVYLMPGRALTVLTERGYVEEARRRNAVRLFRAEGTTSPRRASSGELPHVGTTAG